MTGAADTVVERAGGAAVALSIGFLCSEYPTFQPQHGGVGSFVETLAAALVRSGHRATVYGFARDEREDEVGGVHLVTIPMRGLWSSIRAMQARIKHDLRSGSIDLAEAAECEAHCLPGGSGTIVRFHGSHHFWCATIGAKKRYRRLLLEQVGIRRAGALCAVSGFAADVTRDAMRLGRRDIEVLSNPVDTGGFAPSRDAAVVRGRILFVGTITPKKGIRELCDSMSFVLGRHPEAELHLVGRDVGVPGGGSYREQIAETLTPAVKSRIVFRGALPRSEVSAAMATAHVCVFPSHMETQGIVILEAMACGRPVVATRRGPGPEVLGSDGDCGLLTDPSNPADIADQICRVLADDELADRLGRRARQRAVAHFSIDTCLRRNLDFYYRQLRRSHVGRPITDAVTV